jgi:glycosyltransferase involved in cell wall biosynthesis
MAEPRVLQVLPELNQGGVERGTIDIANALVDAGYSTFVCSFGGKLVSELEKLNVTHIKLPVHSKNPIIIIKNIFKLKDIIKQNEINIVHARSRAPAWSSYFACWLTGCNFVTTFHGAYGAEHSLKRFYNSVMLRGKRVIAISNFILKHIETRYRCNTDRISVIHRGVDLKYFDPELVDKKRVNDVKKILNVPLNGKIILMPARVTRLKGHLYMLEALKYLKDQDFTFLIVGTTTDKHYEYKKEIERTIIAYGLKDKVSIHSAITDVPALYSLCDIVVCPTITAEAFGRTITEAQAMEKLIVATRIGAPVEIIEDGKTGFLVSPQDPSDMTDLLKKLFKLDAKTQDKIIKSAKLKVQKEFSLHKMCSETLNIYKEVLNT